MHQIWFARSTAKPRSSYDKSCALDRTLQRLDAAASLAAPSHVPTTSARRVFDVAMDANDNAVCSNRLALPENVWVAEIESGRMRHQPTNLPPHSWIAIAPDLTLFVGRFADSAP